MSVLFHKLLKGCCAIIKHLFFKYYYCNVIICLNFFQIEQEISKKYKNRPVNIMGGVAAL